MHLGVPVALLQNTVALSDLPFGLADLAHILWVWLKCYVLPVLQSRLRKQDVGLKTHLQQLDQQISELKLDVSKASTEQLESDSRPSSGL